MIDGAIKYWWRKWIKKSLFFTTTGEKWKNYLQELSSKKGFVVRNGFESKVLNMAMQHTKEFKIVHFGRIYQNQNLTLFLKGFLEFIQSHRSSGVKLELVGLKKELDFDARREIKSMIPDTYISEVPYMPKKTLLQYCQQQASLFWLPNFKEDQGQFMVKLYDYMSLCKPTILCPGNGSELEKVIDYTGAGVTFNTLTPLVMYLEKSYSQYLQNGYVPFEGDQDKINEYRREKQVANLATMIQKNL